MKYKRQTHFTAAFSRNYRSVETCEGCEGFQDLFRFSTHQKAIKRLQTADLIFVICDSAQRSALYQELICLCQSQYYLPLLAHWWPTYKTSQSSHHFILALFSQETKYVLDYNMLNVDTLLECQILPGYHNGYNDLIILLRNIQTNIFVKLSWNAVLQVSE